MLNQSVQKTQDREMLECSFQPNLDRSVEMFDKERNTRNRIGTFNLLYSKAGRPNAHVECLRKLKEQLEIAELRDKPVINEVSQKIVDAKRGLSSQSNKENQNISNILFEESRILEGKKNSRMEEESKKNRFKPEINSNSSKAVKLLGKDFYQRVDHFAQKRALKLKEKSLEKENSLKYDPITKQPLFKPTLNKIKPPKPPTSPSLVNKIYTKSISRQVSKTGNILLNTSLPVQSTNSPTQDANSPVIQKKSQNSPTLKVVRTSGTSHSIHLQDSFDCKQDNSYDLQPASSAFVVAGALLAKPIAPSNHGKRCNSLSFNLPVKNKISDDINRQKEAAVARELFETMDADKDGILSADNISLESIPTAILKILSPLLFELEELNQTLDQDEFGEAFRNLIKTLTPQDRRLLCYGEKKLSPADPDLTFNVVCSLTDSLE
jgi:hypothetical protein